MWQSLSDSECLSEGIATINCFPVIIGNIIFWLLTLAGIVAVAMIIFSGFRFVTSGGDPKQAEGAKKTLTFAVLGFVLVLLAFIILPFIAKVTGISNACITRFGFGQCVPEDISHECNGTYTDGFCPGTQACRPVGPPGLGAYDCVTLCRGSDFGWCTPGEHCRSSGGATFSCRP